MTRKPYILINRFAFRPLTIYWEIPGALAPVPGAAHAEKPCRRNAMTRKPHTLINRFTIRPFTTHWDARRSSPSPFDQAHGRPGGGSYRQALSEECNDI